MGGGAWPILVGGVTCLVNFDNERDPSCLVACTCNFAGDMFLNGPSD